VSDIAGVNPVPVEARDYQGMRAGVVSRTIAASIDFFIVLAIIVFFFVGWLAFLFLVNPVAFTFPNVSFAHFLLAYACVLFLYLASAWGTSGRTYGNHVMGLRVVNFRGRQLRIAGAVLRAAFYTVFPIGLFWCAVSKQNRSVQDTVLRTSVIYDWTHRNPSRQARRAMLRANDGDVPPLPTTTQHLTDPGA
jgi:uncharacterized RDD family membrane protein YckC